MARQARCICGKINPSDEALPGYKSLPFFEARGPGSPWSLDTCVHCRFAARAHEPEVMARNTSLKCETFEPGAVLEFDSFYCGCRGWD